MDTWGNIVGIGLEKERIMNIRELYGKVQERHTNSTFGRGVTEYALEMLDSVISGDYDGISGDSDCTELNVGHLLNHVDGNLIKVDDVWDGETASKVRSLCDSASYGGNFLIYNDNIVERLCPPSTRKRSYNKAMDLQGRALLLAVKYIRGVVRSQCRY
jgi:hypothetical protein